MRMSILQLKQTQLEQVAKHREELKVKPHLRWLFFEITKKCNLRCMHCGSSCTSIGESLSVQDIEKTLSLLLLCRSKTLILQKIADRVRWQENRVFTFLSKSSMPVYLLHQQVIYVCLYFLNGKLNPYLHSAVNFAGAMLVSLLLSALLLKFKWTRALIGEK
jgi:hypothetical protein